MTFDKTIEPSRELKRELVLNRQTLADNLLSVRHNFALITYQRVYNNLILQQQAEAAELLLGVINEIQSVSKFNRD